MSAASASRLLTSPSLCLYPFIHHLLLAIVRPACLPAFWALSHCHLPSFIYELAAPVQVLFWSCGAFLFSFRLLSFCSVSLFYSFAVLLLLSIRYRACCIWRVAFNQLPGTLPSDFLTGHKSGLDRDWD